MIEFYTSVNMHEWCAEMRRDSLTIGFVPTMGALHEGHMSLIRIARQQCDIVVASIFVNPTQFNDPADYEKYPISLEKDLKMLENESCDAVFIPGVYEIYPNSKEYDLEVDLGYLAECMEAAKRPGHFEGVMQVVKLLLEVVAPDILFLGRKDYQQFLVVSKMVETYKLPVVVEKCPIIREEDGLAMSSRNRRLTDEGRLAAVELSRALYAIQEGWNQGNPDELVEKYTNLLNSHGEIEVEYLVIVDGESLRPITNWNESKSAITFIAAFIDGIRLIDNVTIY